jgi:short-subunit dehydrogenase
LALNGISFLGFVGRNWNALEEVAQSAGTEKNQIFCYGKDLCKDEDIADLAKQVIRDMGRVDILIHSAGIISTGFLENTPVSELDRQYQTNVRAPYLLTQALLPMLKQFKGQIVFINSSVGFSTRKNLGQYAASKYALKAISDSLRDEVKPYGIRVLSVYPGQTATPMQKGIYETLGKTYRPHRLLQPEDVAEITIAALRLPRTAEAADIFIRPMNKP